MKAGSLLFIVFILTACSTSENKQEKELQEGDSLSAPKIDTGNYLTNCEQLFHEAKRMDSVLMSQTEVVEKSANQAIKAFTDFAYYCASDSLSPVFLIKSAQVARVVNNIPQAKLVLERCIDNYPSFENRAAAIFLLAQLYDEPTYLNNEQEAKKLYQKIIDEYPKSDWAQSAKGALKFLGKSDEEIMKELKKKI